MIFNLDLHAVPDATLQALQLLCGQIRDRAPVLFDALRAATMAEGERRNEGTPGCVELDLTGATILDVSDGLNAALACAHVTTGYAHGQPDNAIAAGWIALALVFLEIRAQLLAHVDRDALLAYRIQSSSSPTTA